MNILKVYHRGFFPPSFLLPTFLQPVFQPLMSAQTGFTIGARQPSGLDYWSLIYLLRYPTHRRSKHDEGWALRVCFSFAINAAWTLGKDINCSNKNCSELAISDSLVHIPRNCTRSHVGSLSTIGHGSELSRCCKCWKVVNGSTKDFLAPRGKSYSWKILKP